MTKATLNMEQATVCFSLWYFPNQDIFLLATLFFMAMMIPLGSFLTPYNKSNKQ